jgi:hypothetical protein
MLERSYSDNESQKFFRLSEDHQQSDEEPHLADIEDNADCADDCGNEHKPYLGYNNCGMDSIQDPELSKEILRLAGCVTDETGDDNMSGILDSTICKCRVFN